MEKTFLSISFVLMSALLAAQNVVPAQSIQIADEDYFDEYEYDDSSLTPSNNSQPAAVEFVPTQFQLNDSQELMPTANIYQDTTPAVEQPEEVVVPIVNQPTALVLDPEQLTATDADEELVQEQDTASNDSSEWNGEGHFIQFGFGGGWSGTQTRISEDLGKSKITGPAFTGSIDYVFFPIKWLGVLTGLQISNYKANFLLNTDAVKTYQLYTDHNGAYQPVRDPDGDTYFHNIGLGNFNEVVNINTFEIPIGLQFKHKFADIAGLYATLGLKMTMPFSSTYKVKSGLVEHYAYYTKYNLTLRNVPGYFGTTDYTDNKGVYSSGKQFLGINFFGYAELGAIIRLTQKLDLMVGAYFDMALHDISMARRDAQKTFLGFSNSTFDYPWMNSYRGLIGTDLLGELRPYNVGIKATLSFNFAPKKEKKDKDDKEGEDDELKKQGKSIKANPNDTLRDSTIIIHDTIIIHRVTNQFVYDSVGYNPARMQNRHYIDTTSSNPYINGTLTRSTPTNSYSPADGDDYVYNEEALRNGRNYSQNLRTRNEALSGDEQEMIDYLSGCSIRFQLDKAYPPFVTPRNALAVIAKTLKAHPDLVIAINGHACKLGTERYNRRLALRRARNIAKLLKMRGVNEDQMLVASYGSNVPSVYGSHNLSLDRRVEIVLLGSFSYEQREAYLNKFAEQIEIQQMVQTGQRDNAYDLYDTFSGEIRVKKGASLARIAKSYYGDPDYWVYLYEANSDVISNPRMIEPGTELMVPELKNIIKGRSTKVVKQEALQLREYYLRQIGYSGTDL